MSNTAHFWDVGKYPPRPTRIEVDGVIRMERRPRTLRWACLDQAGNVRELSLSNGTAHRDPDNLYGARLKREKVSKGMLPVSDCPLTRREYKVHLPEDIQRETPCSAGDFNRLNLCPHMEKLQEHRQAEWKRKEAVRAERYRSQEAKDREKALENQDRIAEAMTEALQAMAAVGGTKRKPNKKADAEG